MITSAVTTNELRRARRCPLLLRISLVVLFGNQINHLPDTLFSDGMCGNRPGTLQPHSLGASSLINCRLTLTPHHPRQQRTTSGRGDTTDEGAERDKGGVCALLNSRACAS